jgi:hypothetical protein
MIGLLTNCQEKVKASDAGRNRSSPPTDFSSDSRPEMVCHAAVKSHPDNVYTMAARPTCFQSRAPAATDCGCFCFGSMDHYISQCTATQSRSSFHPSAPHSSSSVPAPAPNPPAKSPHPYCSRPHPALTLGFHAHYPVLTPSYAPYTVSYGQ